MSRILFVALALFVISGSAFAVGGQRHSGGRTPGGYVAAGDDPKADTSRSGNRRVVKDAERQQTDADKAADQAKTKDTAPATPEPPK